MHARDLYLDLGVQIRRAAVGLMRCAYQPSLCTPSEGNE